jgi:hypothetical protein
MGSPAHRLEDRTRGQIKAFFDQSLVDKAGEFGMTGESHFVALFQRPVARAIQSPQLLARKDGKGRIVASVEHIPLVITDDNERLGLIGFELLTQRVKRRIDAVDVALDHFGSLQLCRVWLGFFSVFWNTAVYKRPAFFGFKHSWRMG